VLGSKRWTRHGLREPARPLITSCRLRS